MNTLLQRIDLRFDNPLAFRLHVALVADSWRASLRLPSGRLSPTDTNVVSLYDDARLPWSPTMYLPRAW